jgi:NADH-quinone oxidoreductase subunit N
VAERALGDDRITNLAGLARRSPALAAALTVFMLSLAGLPPFAGFAGKFLLFARALQGGAAGWDLLWLIVVALLLSPVALYYYLRVLKAAYVTSPSAGAAPFSLRWTEIVVLGATALGVTLFGCLPQPLIGLFEEAIRNLAR